MTAERLVLCNGARPKEAAQDTLPASMDKHLLLELSSHQKRSDERSVNIRFEDVARPLLANIPDRLIDLLEIAAFVFAADCGTARGEGWEDDGAREKWSRDIRFAIPVRDTTFWTRDDINNQLVDVLGFLSDDNYLFEFHPITHHQPSSDYFCTSNTEGWDFHDLDRVIMFSGGLDSLAGALDTAAAGGRAILVSHRPVSTLSRRQSELYAKLDCRFPGQLFHIPVWINKEKDLSREPTQRTRSFLYASLGTVIAGMTNAKGVRFYENGIVSLNLPIVDEAIRARASRTTHPYVLQLMSQLFSSVLDRELVLDNPFLFKTKGELVATLAARGAADLLSLSCSCIHTWFRTTTQPHCGTCSQCIDRRFAVLAADLAKHEPPTDYEIEVFTGARAKEEDQRMAVNYIRHGIELSQMSADQMASKFNTELSRATRPFHDRRESAQKLIDAHRRHGETVLRVLDAQLQAHSQMHLTGRLDPTCLLSKALSGEHLVPTWRAFSDRIAQLLQRGLRKACKTKKPDNERHLQEICDGILVGNGDTLVREFPMLRWASRLTKPDWSDETRLLWIELKYVRAKRTIGPINEAIAADITKYGDNNRRVLFLVYDPMHRVPDDAEFIEAVGKRDTMMLRFLT